MSEKYKIGDVSKLLNIPVQTLRYYEEQGILHPEKNESTGYRYYDAWDLNSLFDAVTYRALDFSLGEIKEISDSDSLEQILDKYTSHEAAALHQIEKYQRMLDSLSRKRQQLQIFTDDLGRFTERMCPGLIFTRFRLRNRVQAADGNTDFAQLNDGLKQWLECIAQANATFLVQMNSLGGPGADSIRYWWGYSMPAMEALKEGIEPAAPNEYLPSRHCLYTVFKTGGEGTFAETFYEDVYKKIIDKNYVINGDPFGRLILKTHEDGQMQRYFEVWFPIE